MAEASSNNMKSILDTVTMVIADQRKRKDLKNQVRRFLEPLKESDPTGESRTAASALLDAILLREPRRVPLKTITLDAFERLPPHTMNEVYWRELDDIVPWVRRQVFALVRSHLVTLTDHASDPLARIMTLRQLIELVIWLVYYQFGLNLAYQFVRNEPSRTEGCFVICKELEAFVRSGVSIDDRRVVAARRAVGLKTDVAALLSENQVGEIAATIAKQFAVTMHLAAELEKHRDGKGLCDHVARIKHAYEWCCGFVHVTPLLFYLQDEAAHPERSKMVSEIEVTVAATAVSASAVLLAIALRDEHNRVRFSDLFARKPATRGAMVNIELPPLAELRKKNQKVELQTIKGQRVVIYDPNKPHPAFSS